MHPNERGHKRLRDLIEAWLKSGELASPPPDLGKLPSSDTSLADVMKGTQVQPCATKAGSSLCAQSDASWLYDQSRDAFKRYLAPLAAVFVGAWLLWLGVLWGSRRRQTGPGQT